MGKSCQIKCGRVSSIMFYLADGGSGGGGARAWMVSSANAYHIRKVVWSFHKIAILWQGVGTEQMRKLFFDGGNGPGKSKLLISERETKS